MSQADARVRTIEGHTYHIYPLPPRRSLEVLRTCITPVLGATLGGALGGKLEDIDIDIDIDLGELARGFAAGIGEAKVDAALEAFLDVTKVVVEGKLVGLREVFDMHFLGRPSALVRWLGEAVVAEYGGFFGGAGASIEGLAAAFRSKLPTISPGSSGGS